MVPASPVQVQPALLRTVHAGDPATVGWYDFSSRATRTAPDTWQLTLDNGQFGSYRPASANAISRSRAVPAYHEGIFRNGFN